jgi:hypothetical protein
MGHELELHIDDPAALTRALASAEACAAAALGPPRELQGVRSYPIAPVDPAGREGALQLCATHLVLSVAALAELRSPKVQRLLEALRELGFVACEEGDPPR